MQPEVHSVLYEDEPIDEVRTKSFQICQFGHWSRGALHIDELDKHYSDSPPNPKTPCKQSRLPGYSFDGSASSSISHANLCVRKMGSGTTTAARQEAETIRPDIISNALA